MTANMKRKDYIRPVAEVIKPNCNGDILESTFTHSLGADGGGRAKALPTFDDDNQQDIYAPFKKDLWADDEAQ